MDHDNQRAPTLEGDPQYDLAHLYVTKIGHDASSLDRRDPGAARSRCSGDAAVGREGPARAERGGPDHASALRGPQSE